MVTMKAAVAVGLCFFVLTFAGGCGSGTPENRDAYRERLIAPITAEGSLDVWRREIAIRADRGLNDEDVLWLITALYSHRGASDRDSVAVALSLSRSSAAASALLLQAHTYHDDHTEMAIYYMLIGAIDNPEVVGLLAVDYEVYGYRTIWAGALARQWNGSVPEPSRFGPPKDNVYDWWLREGKARFFSAYPELAKLNYPDGPFIMVPDNRPRPANQ